MGLLWTILGVSPLAVGAWLTARCWFKTEARPVGGLSAFLLAWVWLTLGMLALGHLGWIAPGPVIGWSFVGLAIGLAGRALRGPGPVSEGLPDVGDRLGWDVALALGLSGWVCLSLGVQSWVYPVKVVSDGPIYHLYFAARWWKEGRIFLVPTPFGESAAPYFPHVGELAMTWLFTLWGGDRLAKLAQVPFWLVSALTTFELARMLGVRRSASALASLIFATCTPYLLFAFEPNVDAIFVAGYLLATFFFVRFALQTPSQTNLVLGALAAGAAWGTKPTGVVFVPPLLACVALYVLIKKRSSRLKLRDLLTLVLVPLVMEGYWLVRNFWLTGNPLYPLHLKLDGWVILRGWYGPEAMPSSPYYLPVREWRAFADTLLSVVDPRLALLWVPAIVVALLPSGSSDSIKARRILALACLANLALYWLVIPYRTQQRFLFQAIGLGVVPLASLLDRAKGLRCLAVALLAFHLLSPQGWPWPSIPWDLSPLVPNASPPPAPPPINLAGLNGPKATWAAIGSLVGLSCFATASLVVLGLNKKRRIYLVVILGLAVIQVWVQSIVIQPEPSAAVLLKFPPFRDYLVPWVQLDLRTQREPARIAYAGTNIPIYLMGSDYRNDVQYINIDAHRDWLLHDYHRAAGSSGQPVPWPDTRPLWDRLTPDFPAWLANLRAEKIRYLVVARVNPAEGPLNVADAEGFPIERTWAESRPDLFVPVYGVAENDPLMKIYALRSGPGGG